MKGNVSWWDPPLQGGNPGRSLKGERQQKQSPPRVNPNSMETALCGQWDPCSSLSMCVRVHECVCERERETWSDENERKCVNESECVFVCKTV